MTDIRKQFDQNALWITKDLRPPKKKLEGKPAAEENSGASKPHGLPPEVAPCVSSGSATCTPETPDRVKAKKKSSPNRERTERMMTRLTPEEKRTALKSVTQSGMGQEEYLRHLLLHEASKLPLAENAANRKVLHGCFVVLNRAAGSVDHIAQNVNAGPLVAHACLKTMLDIQASTRGILEHLESIPVRRKRGPRPRPSRPKDMSPSASTPKHNKPD